MSFGKMTEFISLQKKIVGKDADGFPEERYGEPIRIRAYKEETYQIVSVENVRGRNRYVQVIAEREVECNGEDVSEDAG